MSRVLGVGIATLDVINYVDGYPTENDEVRAIRQTMLRGGNVTNSLVILSQLGHRCSWAGTIADEPDSHHIDDDLNHHDINCDFVTRLPHGKVPTSYINLNTKNGSRTIVHYRDLPELSFADFRKIDLTGFDWIHFEGRNLNDTILMLRHCKQKHPGIPVSLEVEKLRDGIDQLFDLPDLLLFSRAFAQGRGFQDAERFLRHIRDTGVTNDLVCGWGDEGAYALVGSELHHCKAFTPDQIVDTLGAGDTLNAGVIHASLRAMSWQDRLAFATKLAGLKCGQHGFAQLVDKLGS